jgi:type II restriction enzyme
MELELEEGRASGYRSRAQRARVVTEHWALSNAYCPACLNALTATAANTRARDFICARCEHGFELKAKSGLFGGRIVDGAWSAMTGRIIDQTQPHLFLLAYTQALVVRHFEVIPKSFLTLSVIDKRPPLAETARRAGWVGCNIMIGNVPLDGRIAYVRNGAPVAPKEVQKQWRQSKFVETVEPEARGWLLATMNCVRQLGARHFSLHDVYTFETSLQKQFPNNRHIRPKLRQQLQLLRDKGWLEFEGGGRYSLRAP